MSPPIRKALNDTQNVIHPIHPEIRGLSHILWTGKPIDPRATARNAVFYGEKAIDRSPCGTGTSARMAQWRAQGRLSPGEPFIHESIIGSQFTGKIEALTEVGDMPAIIPSIEGWAVVIGINTLFIDAEEDPFAHGFTVL
jgi:4-hydroxyproline epimerase